MHKYGHDFTHGFQENVEKTIFCSHPGWSSAEQNLLEIESFGRDRACHFNGRLFAGPVSVNLDRFGWSEVAKIAPTESWETELRPPTTLRPLWPWRSNIQPCKLKMSKRRTGVGLHWTTLTSSSSGLGGHKRLAEASSCALEHGDSGTVSIFWIGQVQPEISGKNLWNTCVQEILEVKIGGQGELGKTDLTFLATWIMPKVTFTILI